MLHVTIRSMRLSPEPGLGGVGGSPSASASSSASPGGSARIDAGSPKIQAFTNTGLASSKRPEDSWKRSPNSNGTGATHLRTFHCKLSDDALAFIDQQVNEWLDAHPGYEVKFTTSNIGEWSGKLGKENHLVVQVWV